GRAGEPPEADLVENDALARDPVRQNDVEGRQPVGGDQQQRVAEVEYLADLAGGEMGKRESVDARDSANGQQSGDFRSGHTASANPDAVRAPAAGQSCAARIRDRPVFPLMASGFDYAAAPDVLG